MDDATVGISRGPADTVLPEPPPSWSEALGAALAADRSSRKEALARVAARHLGFVDVWAELADAAADPVEAYAYARVGYHRGLDALRANGWKGSGYVRYAHPANRGFLRALEALGRLSGQLGDDDEAVRCARFLRQLDPGWPPAPPPPGPGAPA